MLRFGICTFESCKVGFRCTGRYSKLFREPLEIIEGSLTESIRKAAINEFVGAIQIEEAARYIVRTASRDDQPLHKGKLLLKSAPGNLVDWCMVQEERGIESMRTVWHRVLDQELTLIAQVIKCCKSLGVWEEA